MNSVFSYLLSSEGGEEGSAIQSEAEVAGYAADICTFPTADAEVDLRKVLGHYA